MSHDKTMKRLFTHILSLLTVWMAATATDIKEIPTQNIPTPAMVTIAVPECYDTDTTLRYPLVILLNGHGGDHTSWGKIVDLDSLATAYNVIIACPAGQNSWYFDSPVKAGMKMESYITTDLIPWIDASYRTEACPSKRAITGLSMGGHGGLWLALRHSDIFGNAGSTSGGVDFTPFPGKWNLPDFLGPYEQNTDVWKSHTVMSLLPDLKPGQLNIIFDCGTEDFFFDVNNELNKQLNLRGIDHVYLTSPGAHDGDYWSKSIIPQLDFFKSKFDERHRCCRCSGK